MCSGHEVAPPACTCSITSLPATTSLHSRCQQHSDLQEDSNSKSGTGTSTSSNEDQGTDSNKDQGANSKDGTGTNSDTNTGVSGNTSQAGDGSSGEAMAIDDNSSGSDDNDKIDSPSGLHLAHRRTVGPTTNNTPTIDTATAAAEEAGPTYGALTATSNGTSDSTATLDHTAMSVATVIAPLATVGDVEPLYPIVRIATSDSNLGGTLKGSVSDSVSTALMLLQPLLLVQGLYLIKVPYFSLVL